MKKNSLAKILVLITLVIYASYLISNIDTKVVDSEPHSITNSSGLKLFVTEVTFHEGFRPQGMKAVDVELKLIGTLSGPNLGYEGKIISVKGETGKVYEVNELDYNDQLKREIAFADVDEKETNVVSLVFLDYKSGKKIEVPVKGITPTVTHK